MDNIEYLNKYLRQTEPEKKYKAINWQTAIGLQKVDNIEPSEYLVETAEQHINGEISIDDAQNRIDTYYSNSKNIQQEKLRTEEADKVSVRITKILAEKTFNLSIIELTSIHKRLFEGIYNHAGKIRDYNIIKKEPILNGDTVIYTDAFNIKETLEFDLFQEKEFKYKGLKEIEIVDHIAKFISGIWQIHPFEEGNTRTTAVFTIKYLHSLGFKDIDNEPFAKNSLYFRNALVRDNYNNLKQNIFAEDIYLKQFFYNLILKQNNNLDNNKLKI